MGLPNKNSEKEIISVNKALLPPEAPEPSSEPPSTTFHPQKKKGGGGVFIYIERPLGEQLW